MVSSAPQIREYVLKQLSHFIRPGTRRLETRGGFDSVLAYRNEDGTVAVVVGNDSAQELDLTISVDAATPVRVRLPESSVSTVLYQA